MAMIPGKQFGNYRIIRVLEFYVEEGVPVLVMEQAPEGTLRDNYPSGTRLPLATVVAYITQACAALQYAHNQNLIHRDVKPENMLLGLEDQLLLGDFGLALFTAFTQEDVADFFGRDALIEQLMESVRDISSESFLHHTETRLLTIIGPSGSGKSSAIMAGLLPRLKEVALAGSMRWVYLQPLIPGAHPLEALLLTLAPHFPQNSLTNIHADLTDDAMRGLYLLAMQLRRASDTKVVLLIDQFEELFTLTASEQERQYFINLLVNAVTEADSPLIVILTLRADFSDWPMHYPKLHQVIEAHRLPILPMSLDELRAVIEQPAMLPDVQLRFEGNLVGDLLFEVSGQVGALPLLAYTLDQLYQKREGHVLTTKAYQDIGGVKSAFPALDQSWTECPGDDAPSHPSGRTCFAR